MPTVGHFLSSYTVNEIVLYFSFDLTNRGVPDPYPDVYREWCESLSLSAFAGGAGYSIMACYLLSYSYLQESKVRIQIKLDQFLNVVQQNLN